MEFLELLYLFLALVANIAYLPFIFFSDLLVTTSVHLGPLLASVPVAASFYTMLALRHAGVFLFRLSVLVLQAAAFCVAYVLAVLYDWAVAQITLTAAERAYNAAVEAENARERALTAQDIRDHGPYGSRGPLFPTPVYDDVPPATFDGLPAAPPRVSAGSVEVRQAVRGAGRADAVL
ncbi:hypothetical protein SLS57_000515 [Botryosphaeria dothidea]